MGCDSVEQAGNHQRIFDRAGEFFSFASSPVREKQYAGRFVGYMRMDRHNIDPASLQCLQKGLQIRMAPGEGNPPRLHF